jgi:hypothetical protein
MLETHVPNDELCITGCDVTARILFLVWYFGSAHEFRMVDYVLKQRNDSATHQRCLYRIINLLHLNLREVREYHCVLFGDKHEHLIDCENPFTRELHKRML